MTTPTPEPPEEEFDAWLAEANRALVAALDEHIDVEAGLAEVKRRPISSPGSAQRSTPPSGSAWWGWPHGW